MPGSWGLVIADTLALIHQCGLITARRRWTFVTFLFNHQSVAGHRELRAANSLIRAVRTVRCER